MTSIERIRPAAVAGAFYPDNPRILRRMIAEQLDYARGLLTPEVLARLPEGAPKAVIVPHAGYVYSGTTAALAYALLERGRGTIRRAVIVGPTHRVAVRGVAMSRATAFATPLGVAPVDVAGEARAFGFRPRTTRADAPDDILLGGYADFLRLPDDTYATPDSTVPALLLNEPTHAREHAVEVQIPFLQTVLGDDIDIVPLNAGSATPGEVGDALRAFWGGPETVVVISSDLSHYHPNAYARALDDETIARIAALDLPIHPNRACGAYPVNGLLDVCRNGLHTSDDGRASNARERFMLRFLGCCTSGDGGEAALADDLTRPGVSEGVIHATRPAMVDRDEAVVGYASFAMWERSVDDDDVDDGADDDDVVDDIDDIDDIDDGRDVDDGADRSAVLLGIARTAIRRYLGIDDAGDTMAATVDRLSARHPWLREPGACFVTLTEGGRLRGCIGTLEAYRPLGRDVAGHAVDAASRDSRFMPVTAAEYPLLGVEVSVLSRPEPMRAASRDELEAELRPHVDGLIIEDSHTGRRATFLPQVWNELPRPDDFVGHLLAKAGLPSGLTWTGGRIRCSRYTVTAYREEA